MTEFIHKKYEVENSEYKGVYKHKPGENRDQIDLSQTNIYLIGLRGSGKSTLAHWLAEEYQIVAVDIDVYIEQRLDKTIFDYVQTNGWQDFRFLESQILEEVSRDKGQVVAPGGGIILSESNREIMRSTGVVFYLMASVDLLVARLQAEPKLEQRPELTSWQLQEEIAQTLQVREPLYLNTLDYILQASKPVDELVEDVKTSLFSSGNCPFSV